MAVRQPCEAMQKAQVPDAVEALDHPRLPRVVQIEQQVAIGREPVGESGVSLAPSSCSVWCGHSPFSPTGAVATIVP